MSLTLIRHTRPLQGNGICYGQTNLDVAASFQDEARLVLSRLKKPDVIISSPLQRCLKLATLAANKFDIPVQIDLRVQEMDFGNWEGVSWSDISRRELDIWAADFMQACPHGGENVMQVCMRVHAALAEYQKSRKVTHIFTHAGVIKAALANGCTAEDFSISTGFGGIVTLPQDLNFRSAS